MKVTESSRVFIKNFGDGNYMWPEALERSAVCLITDSLSHQFFMQSKQTEYRDYAHAELKTSKQKVPDSGTITLWWNTQSKLENATTNDIFIHDDGTHLYWTQLKDEKNIYEDRPDPFPRGRKNARVVITLRPAQPWRKTNLKDVPLALSTLHPYSPHIIRTRMTMAEAGEDNRDYILSLIRGDDLNKWHSLPSWKEAYTRAGQDLGRSYSAWEVSAADIVYQAKSAAKQGGKEVLTKKKEKLFGFLTDQELASYVLELHAMQNGICNLTGITYTPRVGKDRGDMMMSLDRIDSSQGYIRGNLQLTCSFANRWKKSDNNAQFLNLIEVIRNVKI